MFDFLAHLKFLSYHFLDGKQNLDIMRCAVTL